MRGRASWVLLVAGISLVTGVADAQCTKDTDCKGDRICEEGKCTSPPGAAAAGSAPESPQVAAPAAASAPVAPPATTSPSPPTAAAPAAATAPLGEDEPATRRHSKGAMITGIVMVSFAPIALLGALSAKSSQDKCDEELQNQYPGHILPESERYRAERCDDYSTSVYVLGIGSAVLGAVGIPLIIYGARTLPAPKPARVQLAPWVNGQSGGLRLKLAL